MASICLMAHSDFKPSHCGKPVCAQVRHDKLKLQFWNAVTAFVQFIATALLDHAEHAELTNVRHAQFQVFRDTLFQSHSPFSRHVYLVWTNRYCMHLGTFVLGAAVLDACLCASIF